MPKSFVLHGRPGARVALLAALIIAGLVFPLFFPSATLGQAAPKADTSLTVAQSVSAEIILDGETLLDGRESRALLKIVNLTDQAFMVAPPRPIAPPEIRITPEHVDARPLPPRSILLLPLRIGVAPQAALMSGKHTIGAVVRVARQTPGPPWSGEVAATREITAGVPGMSEIQNVLQIPSFLLLPGLLLVASFYAARSLFPATPAAGAALVWSPWLWIVAISFSGLVAYIYPEVSTWFGPVRRNILYGYSLIDVAAIWIGSIAVGALVGSAAGGWIAGWATHARNRRFLPGEPPLAFLERLMRMKKPHQFAFVIEDGKRLYRLDPAEQGATRWAAPAIRVTAKDDAFDRRPISVAADGADLVALHKLLATHAGTKAISLAWDGAGAAQGPAEVPSAKFERLNQQLTESIVQTGPGG